MTTAERFAEAMGNDGTRFTAPDGRSIVKVAASFGARQAERAPGPLSRYTFPDGSSIIVAVGAWDVALSPSCWCWQGAGHSEACIETSQP